MLSLRGKLISFHLLTVGMLIENQYLLSEETQDKPASHFVHSPDFSIVVDTQKQGKIWPNAGSLQWLYTVILLHSNQYIICDLKPNCKAIC